MSKEVKRYNFSVDNSGSVRGYESEHGRWVKRTDYDALLAERDRLREALEELITWIPSADTYRRLGFDPEAPMRALDSCRACL